MIKQDERWQIRYNEVMAFIETNHRNPSHHFYEERNMHSWVRHNRKLMKAGEMKSERIEAFEKLLAQMEVCKRVNQWV